jgi:hypothetical protein
MYFDRAWCNVQFTCTHECNVPQCMCARISEVNEQHMQRYDEDMQAEYCCAFAPSHHHISVNRNATHAHEEMTEYDQLTVNFAISLTLSQAVQLLPAA